MAMTATTASVASPARSRTRHTIRNMTLWTLQGWIAMFFIAAGYAKLTEPMTNLVALLNWPALVDDAVVRGLGIVEIVLAVGILTPLASWRVGRPLLVVSSLGLILLEATMLVVHALGGDTGLAVVNGLLLAITLPVLAGRRAR